MSTSRPPGPGPAAPGSAPGVDREFVRRFGRQLIVPEIGLEGQRRLGASRVLIVGLGGLGASVALHLATAGVGELHLVDPDVVELSNLHRQVLYTTDDVGRPKAEAAARHLRARDPNLRLRAETTTFDRATAVERVAAVDVVVDATDNFPSRYRISDAAVRARRPEVFAAVHRLEGQFALFDAATGPCYRCLFPEAPPPEAAPGCGEAGVLGVVPALLGTLQAVETLRLLLGWRGSEATRLWLVDAESLDVRHVIVRRRSDCAGCGPGAAESPMPEEPEERLAAPGVPEGFRFIEPRALSEELAGRRPPTVIDVRESAERALGSIPGDRWIPLEALPGRLSELSDAVRPVVYCQWGGRSERAGRLLAEAGLREVRVLRGGLDAYAAEVDPSLPRL